MAQLAAQRPVKATVLGSNPGGGACLRGSEAVGCRDGGQPMTSAFADVAPGVGAAEILLGSTLPRHMKMVLGRGLRGGSSQLAPGCKPNPTPAQLQGPPEHARIET